MIVISGGFRDQRSRVVKGSGLFVSDGMSFCHRTVQADSKGNDEGMAGDGSLSRDYI